MRFETAPGDQAQVDRGSLSYRGEDGKRRSLWVFVMTLGWSRACYVELVRQADTAAFIQCIGDDQFHPAKPAGIAGAQEGQPEGAVLAGSHVQAQCLPLTGLVEKVAEMTMDLSWSGPDVDGPPDYPSQA